MRDNYIRWILRSVGVLPCQNDVGFNAVLCTYLKVTIRAAFEKKGGGLFRLISFFSLLGRCGIWSSIIRTFVGSDIRFYRRVRNEMWRIVSLWRHMQAALPRRSNGMSLRIRLSRCASRRRELRLRIGRQKVSKTHPWKLCRCHTQLRTLAILNNSCFISNIFFHWLANMPHVDYNASSNIACVCVFGNGIMSIQEFLEELHKANVWHFFSNFIIEKEKLISGAC